MKILIGVMGAEAHIANGLHQASRETYGQDAHNLGDMRYFVGRGEMPLQTDEIRLDVPDLKDGLLEKVVGMFRWALDNGYEAIFKVDTDTYINIRRMVNEGFLNADYAGIAVGNIGERYSNTEAFGFIQGSCSLLSAKAMRAVLDFGIVNFARERAGENGTWWKYAGTISPTMHSEDLWIGQALHPRIKAKDIVWISNGGFQGGPLTYHCPSNVKGCAPQWMREVHAAQPNDVEMHRVDREWRRKRC